MKKPDEAIFTRPWIAAACARLFMVVATLMFAMTSRSQADIPDRQPTGPGGIYKLVSSTDPLFPSNPAQEVFLDFGRGSEAGKTSGSVAISVRRNPNVKVVIMAWQFLQDHGKLVLGNRFGQGSRNAVAKGVWFLSANGKDMVLERGTYRVILQPADPNDY